MMIILSRNRHDCDHEIIVVRQKDVISANDLTIRWSLGGYDLYMEILKGNLRPLKGVKEPRQSKDDGILYFCIDLSLPPDPRFQEDTIGIRKTPPNRLDRIFNRALGIGPDFSNVFFYIKEIEEHEHSNPFLIFPVVKETNTGNIQEIYKNKSQDTSIESKRSTDQVYNPENATHSAKVKEAARLERENLKLPREQRMKRADMAIKIFGSEPRGDRERQLRSLLKEAREEGLLPTKNGPDQPGVLPGQKSPVSSF